jgi:hypothetical protein
VEIIANTPASTGSFSWTVPNIISDVCRVKLTDVSDINVYDKSNSVFSILLYELALTSPNGGEYYTPGNSTSITWENTLVSDIKIEYTGLRPGEKMFEELSFSEESVQGTEIEKIYCLKSCEDTDGNAFEIVEEMSKIGRDEKKMRQAIWDVVPKYDENEEREIVEELGVESVAGKFLGMVEHNFIQKGRQHCEWNVVFELSIDSLEPENNVIAAEDHISFKWCKVGDLKFAKLEPAVLCKLLPQWLTDDCKEELWASGGDFVTANLTN